MFKLIRVLGKNVCCGKDVKVFTKLSEVLANVSPDAILAAHLVTAREMVYLLVLVKVTEDFWGRVASP